MPASDRIDIAVPTYNCSRWIDEFFNSLLAQDYVNWHVIARDDGSTDDTSLKLEVWKQRLSDRMTIISNDGRKNLGAVASYNLLLESTSSSWVMMGDPDDVWCHNKITLSIDAMRRLEARQNKDVPLVVSSDATMVDENLNIISSSFWRWANLNPKFVNSFSRMIVEHPGLCATMLVNRAALNVALPLTRGALHQDWWLILIACAFGEVCLIPEPTILYRRHSNNFSGVPLTTSFFKTAKNIHTARQRMELIVAQFAMQAAAFLDIFGAMLNRRQIKALSSAASLPKVSSLERKFLVLKGGLWFSSTIKNIVFFVLL